MLERRRSERALATITAGVVVGLVEVVLAISFAALKTPSSNINAIEIRVNRSSRLGDVWFTSPSTIAR